MRRAGKSGAIASGLALLLGACVTLDQIQRTSPIYATSFTGSHKAVAQCVHQRLGGRLHEDPFERKYVIYNAVKASHAEGLTHYAITVGQRSSDLGFAEWRVMTAATSDRNPRRAISRLSSTAVQQYWAPVEDCAAKAGAAS
jgi:hypothetical protein